MKRFLFAIPLVILCLSSQSRPIHLRVTAWDYQDQTDVHEEICQTREWLLAGNEAPVNVRANVLDVFDLCADTGVVWLVEGPVAASRWTDDPDFTVSGRGIFIHTNGFPVVCLPYGNGRIGRIRALHRHQRKIRPYDSRRDGLILSNTWGDRHRFDRINEADMLKEVAAAARLGIDVMQIDAGWAVVNDLPREQITGAGEWERYWRMPRENWNVNSNRFPRGLNPISEAARKNGMAFGLWFAPDCSEDSAHWRRDADILLSLYRDVGVRFFKTDFMSVRSFKGYKNQLAFFTSVLDGANGDVSIDLDVTGHVPRLGYFGAPRCAIFVENRYERKGDGRLWWPHRTLRNLWTLAEAVDPVRLRMEFMNPQRHPELYGDSPLAPKNWPVETIFATVMAASPLAWMDCVDLSPEVVVRWRPLVDVWKRERRTWHGGTIIPIGDRPDGFSWTGFVSTGDCERVSYVLLFRELSRAGFYSLDLKDMVGRDCRLVEVLAGKGSVILEKDVLTVNIPDALGFLWLKLLHEDVKGVRSNSYRF